MPATCAIAAESANFIQSFINIGLIPDSGGTFTLPRLVGHAARVRADDPRAQGERQGSRGHGHDLESRARMPT